MLQYMPVPHPMPSVALRENVHTAAPVEQSSVLTMQGVAVEEQSPPALQTEHAPPRQKCVVSVPHGVPSVTAAPAAQTSPPSLQVSVPA